MSKQTRAEYKAKEGFILQCLEGNNGGPCHRDGCYIATESKGVQGRSRVATGFDKGKVVEWGCSDYYRRLTTLSTPYIKLEPRSDVKPQNVLFTEGDLEGDLEGASHSVPEEVQQFNALEKRNGVLRNWPRSLSENRRVAKIRDKI